MVSQEIRTPLNGVLGVLSLLNASEELTAESRQLVTAAQDGAKVLMRLLGDIIELSQLEAAPFELQLGDISPLELCEDVLAAVSPAACKKGLAVVSRIDSRLPEKIRADGGAVASSLAESGRQCCQVHHSRRPAAAGLAAMDGRPPRRRFHGRGYRHRHCAS